jgi:hypothetical protein
MIENPPYSNIFNLKSLPTCLTLVDHLGGFDEFNSNPILERLDNFAKSTDARLPVSGEYKFTDEIIKKYNNLLLHHDINLQIKHNGFDDLSRYTQHPEISYKNFICSFNGSPHVSRKYLVSILNRFGYFDPQYCSKNFSYSTDILDGHIKDYAGDQHNFYRKFFIADSSKDFFQTVYSFGHVRTDHGNNIYTLEDKITKSFLHIVSETMATSYQPFVTEKFLYSIVTRGLFLCYAQPNWHDHVEKYYGFKRYTKLFDYKFDTIKNPIKRLVELMSMISKFSMLSSDEWNDLYQIEQETIEYNYDHFFSKQYIKHLAKHQQENIC